MTQSNLIQHVDLTEQVYGILREWLVTRRLEPGAKLSLQELAEEFGVSRSPVHHALTRLCAEGLIAVRPRQGYYVMALDATVVENAYEVRLALELQAAEKTLGLVSGAQLATFRRLMEATLAMVADGQFIDKHGYIAANQALHNHQIDLAGNPLMSDIYRRLAVNLMMDRILFGQDTPAGTVSDEHVELVEAFETADLPRAQRAIRTHCNSGRTIAMAAIAEGGGVR